LFPVVYLVFFFGYSVILLVDRIVSSHFGSGHGHGHGGHSHGSEKVHEKKHHAHVNGHCVEHHLKKQKLQSVGPAGTMSPSEGNDSGMFNKKSAFPPIKGATIEGDIITNQQI
jgi:hypothetical protein